MNLTEALAACPPSITTFPGARVAVSLPDRDLLGLKVGSFTWVVSLRTHLWVEDWQQRGLDLLEWQPAAAAAAVLPEHGGCGQGAPEYTWYVERV